MFDPPPDDRVIAMWRDLARAPHGFAQPGIVVVSTDEATLTRPGFCGVVVLGKAAVVVTPKDRPAQVDRLLAAVSDQPSAAFRVGLLTDERWVEQVVGPLETVIGPADLQYGAVEGRSAAAGSTPDDGVDVRGPLPRTDPTVEGALAGAPPGDRSEAGFDDDTTDGIFVALERGEPAAISGYRRWEGGVAHMGVLTLPAWRRRGMGTAAAAAAAAYATDEGLVVQWRSRGDNHASRLLGQRLGLRHCGRQLSVRFAEP